ncbi:c-type cytochrome [Desulfuromonas versatilis]|uniref:C-type cytochrome n=1 Tax=Desulfuromonas versatilis TaxID=2802975 RepID=A0ABM8HWT6_9BACT|nr:CxxxxCH/CxxCH domain-containing protein [Desulfuromonas versatilis]BCR05572.1 c-type cytochrome [Desulfuromonas versatilis]
MREDVFASWWKRDCCILVGLFLALAILAGSATAWAASPVALLGSWSKTQQANLAFTPAAGSDRVILVAVTGEDANQAATVSSVTYGGQLVTPINSAVRGAGYSNIAWLGFCNETCISNASGNSIVVNTNVDNQYVVAAAAYANVDQTQPVFAHNANTSNSSTITASLNNADGNKVVYVVAFNGNQASSTPSTGFSNRVRHDAGGNSHTMVVDDRTATTSATPLSISTSSGSGSSRTAIVAVSLQQRLCAASAPTDLLAVAPHGGRVDLTWSYDGTNNDYYTIYRNGTPIGTSTSGSYADLAVTVSTGYNYTVKGFNQALNCESDASNTANVTTGPCAPTTGPITVDGGQLSGQVVNLTSLVSANGATVSTYTVSQLLAPELHELESFTSGDPQGWSAKWTTDNEGNPPGNRDLATGISTRSDGTGPATAPTGSFLYYEASDSATALARPAVRYLTHVGAFNANANELLVSFKYHMYGSQIGSLELQANSGSGWTTVWSKTGNQGNSWKSASVDLEALGYSSGNVSLRFKFAYGTGYLGDIALDEVLVHGPGRAGTVYFTGNATAAQSAATNGGSPWPDATTLRLDIFGADNCSTALNDVGTFDFYVDNTPPTVNSFTLPATAVSPISVLAFSVTDNIGVTGYLVTESPAAPAASNPGWQSTVPTHIRTASTGSVTFYAWAKDAAGNVSTSRSQVVTVSADGTAPTVDSFTMPDSSFSPIPVSAFFASDNSGVVAGYQVTESATPPAAGDAGWQANPPASVTTASTGSVTFYAWAKDEAGNVSAPATHVVTVKVDTNPPVVTFTIPGTSSSLTFNVSTYGAVDNVPDVASNTGVSGYMITESGVDADPSGPSDPRWLGAPPLKLTASTDGSRTFKAWAKDSAGNISAAVSRSITITLPATCDYDINPAGTYIEAENYTQMTAPSPWEWTVVTTPLADASGRTSSGGYLSTTVGGTGTTPNGSRTDYPVNFTSGGTYCIWIRALDAAGAGGGDSTFWGIDGSLVGTITQTADNQWSWDSDTQNGSNCTTVSSGPHTINLWPREAGQKTDGFFIATLDANADPSAGGIFTGDDDQTTTVAALGPKGVKLTVDPTCVDSSGGGAPGSGGGGSGYIDIPDGQTTNGNPINPENLYVTDLGAAVRQYRALGRESDGFNGFSLNSKWSKTDIGGNSTPAPSVVNEQLSLTGRGADIWGNSDAFAFLYQGGKSGSFTIDVKVDSVQPVNGWAKGGIMVRQSLANNSPHAMIVLTPDNGVSFQRRRLSGGTSYSTTAAGVSQPKWLRLKRTGNNFFGYYSNDGISWVLVGNDTVNMTDPVNIGLAVTSHTTAANCTAVFDNFMFMPASVSGMSETWNNTSSASPASIATTGWSDGDYALSVRGSGVEPETNTFSFSSCTDVTPSTITVHSGQTIGGSASSLNALFDHTGNVGTFHFQINGIDVLNPWNSYSVVPDGTSASVTLKVFGTDPDCGGKSLSASGTITVNNSCSDPDPSTITILTGQSTGGGSVDLTAMASTTGDVAAGGLTYKINGQVIGDPASWDSRSYGTTTPQAVTFEVSGTDPDCGNVITAVNLIEIDNACVYNPPSIKFAKDLDYVGPGRAIPFTVTVRNEDSFNCGASTLTVTMDGDSNLTNFDPSYFPDPSSITDAAFSVAGDKKSASITLAGRQSAQLELAVSAKAGAPEWNSNITTLRVSSDSGSDSETAETVVFLVSPITHNSVTTNSAKWGGTVDGDGNTVTQGNWGTSDDGSKYGNFDCLTCHEKGGPNVKWLRGAIDMPADSDDPTWGTSGLSSLTISFLDQRPGSDDWGNDDPLGTDAHPADSKIGAGRTGSTRACEVCHSVTMYHRYDTEADPDGAGPLTGQAVYNHFNDRDCTDCHRHSLGFTASCTGCHGNPPLEATLGGPNGLADIPGATGSTTPGTHYKHVVVLQYPCVYCHAGWRDVGEMPKVVGGKQDINHKFDVFGRQPADIDYATAITGHYTGQDGVSYEGVVTPTGQGTMTCENIYCHGGTDTMGGTNPQWNGNIACNSCHGTSATNTPPGYSHTTHVGKMGQACTVCHGDGTVNPLPGSNGHVNGSVGWDLTGAPNTGAAATYKGSTMGETGKFAPSAIYDGYGTCTNVACHYGTETPPWNSGPATCTTCHNNGTDNGTLTNAAPATGEHDAHMVAASGSLSEKMINAFINKCESCHGGGANTGTHPGHIGASHGTSPVDLADYVDFGGMTYDHGTETCTSLCHAANDPGIWGSHQPLSCEACHMAPYLGPTVVDPDNEGTGMAAQGFGSHLKVTKGETISTTTNWMTQCQKCHPYHTGGVEIPEPTTSWDNPGTATVESENMAMKLGLMFPVTGGIHLGGASTSGSTEADICWNCHGTDSQVNEWGYNYDTNGANFPETKITPDTTSPTGHTYWDDSGARGSYNYGYLYTSNHSSGTYNSANATSKWVDSNGWGHYRRDGYQHHNYPEAGYPDYILSRRITSVHSVNFDPAKQKSSVATAINGSGVVVPAAQEVPQNIRCSYCHDVHDLNKAMTDTAAGVFENSTGRPYLRGTWMGNPYAPDLPPLSNYETAYNTTYNDNTYNSNNRTFSSGYDTPRLFSNSQTSKMKGGYFIDANSNRPTTDPSYDSLEETAGICVVCHGKDVNNMDFYSNTTTTMWRTGQVNGHANSTLGGEGAAHANAMNIFDATRGQTNRVMAHQSGVAQGREWGKNRLEGGPFQNSSGMDKAFDTSNPTLNVTGWYGGTPNSDPSSKPAEYSTWYSANGIGTDGSGGGMAHSFTCSKCHSPHATGLPALLITNCLDKNVSSWALGSANPSVSQANNCHRKESTSTGWHKLAPAQ